MGGYCDHRHWLSSLPTQEIEDNCDPDMDEARLTIDFLEINKWSCKERRKTTKHNRSTFVSFHLSPMIGE